jgi:copper chaperone CopZ
MTTLRVPDMHCDHCKTRVSKALSGLSGVSQVDVDLATKDVKVTHEPSVGLDQLKGAVEAAGYTVA